jgi:DNA-binding HxlR family transcriptional regulator
VKEYLDDINKAFESKVRLGIMSMLMVNDEVEFNTFKEMLGLTDGNLASHLKTLEGLGYIDVKKQFVDRKPRTTYSRSPAGEQAFKVHLQALEALIRQTAD